MNGDKDTLFFQSEDKPYVFLPYGSRVGLVLVVNFSDVAAVIRHAIITKE
jgi:hypothetical protein